MLTSPTRRTSPTRWPTWGDAPSGGTSGGWSAAGLREAVRNHRTEADRAAFDGLYAATVEPLLWQAYLLTGAAERASACVRRAFAAAWADWPEVAADPEPQRWVRAAVHADALAPWHDIGRLHGIGRLEKRRSRRGGAVAAVVEAAGTAETVGTAEAVGTAETVGTAEGAEADEAVEAGGGCPPGEVEQVLLAALRGLTGVQRSALVLHEMAGLDTAAVALEAESSTPAAEARIAGARAAVTEALATTLPTAAGAGSATAATAGLGGRLRETARRGCSSVPSVPPEKVRRQSARRTRVLTGAAGALVATALLCILATALGFGPSQLLVDHSRTPDPAPACPGGWPADAC
ncbi:RNA polymerase sigma factor [Peterkaempfera sp. SMS 1(5)a]|uniref:RNA polymerase sigma factor n=1 Tax=Peterkaempfera podocarpi TaxID=3232308 RepID=UPI00367229E0